MRSSNNVRPCLLPTAQTFSSSLKIQKIVVVVAHNWAIFHDFKIFNIIKLSSIKIFS